MLDEEIGRPHGHPAKFSAARHRSNTFGFERLAQLLQVGERFRRGKTIFLQQALFIEDSHWSHPNRNAIKFAFPASQTKRSGEDIFVDSVLSH